MSHTSSESVLCGAFVWARKDESTMRPNPTMWLAWGTRTVRSRPRSGPPGVFKRPPPSAPRGLTRATTLAEPHGHRLQARQQGLHPLDHRRVLTRDHQVPPTLLPRHRHRRRVMRPSRGHHRPTVASAAATCPHHMGFKATHKYIAIIEVVAAPHDLRLGDFI